MGSKEDTFELMGYWYERAVDDQKKELKDYKKKLKAQESLQIEPVPLIIEEDLPHGQGDRPELIKA